MSTIQETVETIKCIAASEFIMPVMLRGRHGIGKTQVFKQLAEETGRKYFAVYGAQLTEGDLLGIPSTVKFKNFEGETKEATNFCLPLWLLKAANEPSVIVFEEIDRAEPTVRKAFMQLACERELWDVKLHPQTVIGAAINGGPTGQHYDVLDMDPAAQDRWAIFELTPTTEEWVQWAKDQDYPPEFIAFVNAERKHLEHKSEFDPNVVYPSRRSWARFLQIIKTGGLYDTYTKKRDNKENYSEEMKRIYFLSRSMLGEACAINLKKHLESLKVYEPLDIIKLGAKMHKEVEDQGRLVDLVTNLINEDHYSDKLSSLKTKEMNNLAAFVFGGSGEIAQQISKLISRKFTKLNTSLLMKWLETKYNGRKVSEYTAELSTAAVDFDTDYDKDDNSKEEEE